MANNMKKLLLKIALTLLFSTLLTAGLTKCVPVPVFEMQKANAAFSTFRVLMGAANIGVPATIEFTDSSVDSSNASTYTFSSQALGSAEAKRKIVVAIIAQGSGAASTIDTVTVAGNSCTQHIEQFSTGAQQCTGGIWSVELASGTTGDIVVTLNEGKTSCGIGVYKVVGASASISDTASDTGASPSASINIPAGGVAVACMYDSSGGTSTWTNLTEAYDEVMESTDVHTGARDAFAAAQTGLAVSTDSGQADGVLVVASWGF